MKSNTTVIKSKKAPRLKTATLKSAITHLLALWLLCACAGSGGSGDYSQKAPAAPVDVVEPEVPSEPEAPSEPEVPSEPEEPELATYAVPGECIRSLHTFRLYKIKSIIQNDNFWVLEYRCKNKKCKYINFRQIVPREDLINYHMMECA